MVELLLNVLFVDIWELVAISFDESLSSVGLNDKIVSHAKKHCPGWVVGSVFRVPQGLITIGEDADMDLLRNCLLQHAPSEVVRIPPVRSSTVSRLFPNPSDNDLHLIVRGAISEVAYLRTDTGEVTVVDATDNQYILKLIPNLGPNMAATFYKPLYPLRAIPQDIEDSIEKSPLLGILLLKDVYPWGPPRGEIHFIVKINAVDVQPVHRDRFEARNWTQQRELFFARNSPETPSSEAVPKTFFKAQRKDESALLCGRPIERESLIPPSLLDETLCRFRHELATITPTAEDIIAFRHLRVGLGALFQHESERRETLIEVFQRANLIPTDTSLRPGFIGGSEYNDDGDIRAISNGVDFIYFFDEVRLDVGTGGGDPFIECIHYWTENVRVCLQSNKISENQSQLINFPVIILLNFGSYIAVAVGVFLETGSVEHLVCVPLHAHSSNLQELHAGERLVAALRLALPRLDQHYSTLLTEPITRPPGNFPFRDFFEVDGETHQFIYAGVVEDKKIFQAHLNDGTKLFVKFTQRYSVDAHRAAIDGGFAPKLYAVNEVYGWFMIVMADVSSDYGTYFDMRREAGFDFTRARGKVTAALHHLHDSGFVHGDVRDVNILVKRRDELEIMFIDWDWAGRQGEARYPHSMNTEVSRAPNAVVGGIITTQHDDHMLVFL